MRETKEMIVAGNLMEELEEINKFVVKDNQGVVYSTTSKTCFTFLTFICC